MKNLESMEQELRELQRQNAGLNDQVEQAREQKEWYQTLLNRLHRIVSSAAGEITEGKKAAQKNLQSGVHMLEEAQGRIERFDGLMQDVKVEYERFKRMETAYQEKRRLKADKNQCCASYDMIRGLAQGIMDNLDLQIVLDKTIEQTVEAAAEDAGDYWLTGVLNFILAQKRGDEAAAQTAKEQAIQRNEKDTSIFFLLISLKNGKAEEAILWFERWMACGDGGLKNSDARTLLLLFALLCRPHPPEEELTLQKKISEFLSEIMRREKIRWAVDGQRQIDRIEKFYCSMKPYRDRPLHMLGRCLSSESYDNLMDTLLLAKNNQNILQFLQEMEQLPETEPEAHLSRFLTRQMAAPGPKELAFDKQIQEQQMLIDCKGDQQEAGRRLKAQAEQEGLDLTGNLLDWIYSENHRSGVSDAMRRKFFQLLLELHKKAAKQYAERYQAREKHQFFVKIGDFQAEIDFQDRADADRSLAEFCDRQKERALAGNLPLVGIGGGVTAAAGVLTCILTNLWGGVVLCAAGGVLIWCAVKLRWLREQQICRESQQARKLLERQMDMLFCQYAEWQERYRQYDDYQGQIEQKFEALQKRGC